MPIAPQLPYQIYNEDCFDTFARLKPGSVDLVLCDPPYGTTDCKWDTIIPLDQMWVALKRVSRKTGAIVLMANQPFTSVLVCSNPKMFKYDWVWDKHIPRNFLNAKRMPMQKHESVLVFSQGTITYYPQMTLRDKPAVVKNYAKSNKDSTYSLNKRTDRITRVYTHRNPDTIIVGKWEANGGKVHPTQKPVALMEYLIQTYTLPGQTVLDFAMGSGTTGVACMNLSRKFIGCDNDVENGYFQIAEKRIKEAMKCQPV